MTFTRTFLAALCANLAYRTAETSNMEKRHGRKKIISWWLTGKKEQFTFGWDVTRTEVGRA